MKLRIISSLLLAMIVGAFMQNAVAADQLSISGSTSVKAAIFDKTHVSLRIATGVDVVMNGNGSAMGMVDLAEGKVVACAISEPLADALASAKKFAESNSKKWNEPAGLQFHQLKVDNLVVIVHSSNIVEKLNKDQLKGIFTGQIKNWSEVGGNNVPIKLFTSEAGSGTRAVFQKQVMDGAEYAQGTTAAENARAELFAVSKDAGAVGVVGDDIYWRNPGAAKVVKCPEISRPLALVTIGKPNAQVQKVIDYFSTEDGKKALGD